MSIRFGTVGAKMISAVYLKAPQQDKRMYLAYITYPDSEIFHRQVAIYGIERRVADYRLMQDDHTIEAVDLTVPHFLHSSHNVRCF